ncbi:MAG: hypothetical protein ACRENV_09155, partial [Candidatus Dormibacteria bacterium]
MPENQDQFEPAPEGVSIFDVLDRLESLVNQSRRLPLTPNIVVNEEDILEAVDQIRMALPDEVREARMVLESREARLREAAEQA